MPKYEHDDDEEKLTSEELDKKLYEIVSQASDEIIIGHIKKSFTKFGIEGTEDVFRRIYEKCPAIKERYQKLYDNLIGRTK